MLPDSVVTSKPRRDYQVLACALTGSHYHVLCRDYVKKVAVYKDRVAIQLPNRVVLYQLEEGAGELDMQYHSTAKINKKLECNLLVVTSQHIVLCQVRSFTKLRNLVMKHAAHKLACCTSAATKM